MKTVIMILTLVAVGFWAVAANAQEGARKPNVIVIVTDDMGYADVGFNGCKDIPTPHIDALARRGVRCISGYVSHPVCSPTRAALLTGRYQQRFGHEYNPRYDPQDAKSGLPVDQTTIAQVMRGAGYKTGAVGKWHLGAAPRFHPNERGFDEWFGFLGGSHQYMDWRPGNAESGVPLQRGRQPVAEKEYLTDAFSREAVAFVERHRAEPFFLYLAYNAPHTPLQAPPKYLDRFKSITDPKRRTYAAMMSAVDDGVGRLSATLRALGLEQGTLVFFFSDNGGPVGERSNGSSNAPLRGGKSSLYEGGVRVPFVVSWPGKLPEGATYDAPVICLDVLPTAAAVAGAKLPEKVSLDGVNLLPHLLGESKTAPHETLFWRTGGGSAWAVRQGRYKLVKQGKTPEQLYDLQDDIGEAKDVAAEKPDLARELQGAYEAWNAKNIPPVFPGAREKPREPGNPQKAGVRH